MNYIDSFLEYLLLEKNYSNHTVTAYRADLKSFYAFIAKEYGLSSFVDVESVYVRRWVMVLKELDVSNRTINRKLASLKTFYSYLQKIEVIQQSPLVTQKSLKTPQKVLTPFSELEIEEALLFVDGNLTVLEQKRNKLMIHLLYGTGIRRSELIGIKVSDVDVSEKTIKVLGKRNKERLVPFYAELLLDLEDYLVERNKISFIDDHLLITKKGRKLYETLVYRVINSYFSRVTTKQKRSPHVLRHSYATDLVNNGADLNSVKELLGHSSLAATQVYTHNSLDKLKQVYNNAHPRGAKKQ